MRNAERMSLIDELKINMLQKCGVLVASCNPLKPSQKGFRFSKSCFLKHPERDCYVRLVGFVEGDIPDSMDAICVNCGDGSKERFASASFAIGGHLYSAVSREEKYDNRPKNEELFIVASSKKEAVGIVKSLSLSGFWSLDRSISIHPSSISRII